MIVRIIICILCALCLPKIWQTAKGVGEHQLSHRLIADVQPPLSAEICRIMAQPFSYWGKGSQFYVFLSSDQHFVLKIPRASKMREGVIDQVLVRTSKKPDVLKSLLTVSKSLMSETAILYTHYGKSSTIPSVILIDRLHRSRTVNLNGIPFAIQERKELMSQALVQVKKRKESERILLAYLDLIESEKKNGLMSHDCAFLLNFGYDSGIVYRLDIGSYIPLEKGFSWRKVTKPAVHWLKNKDPSLCSWFENEIKRRQEQK